MLVRAMALAMTAIVLAAGMPAGAAARPAFDPTAPPATLSPLDPIRVAADFAPARPALAAEATTDETPVDSLPPVMRRLQEEFALPDESKSQSSRGTPSTWRVLGAGIVGGAVGFASGAVVGHAIDDRAANYGELSPTGVGALVGETFLLPAGAHLGNDRRGSYGSALFGSVLGMLAVVVLESATSGGGLVGLGLQIGLVVTGEMRSAKRKSAERAAEAAGRSPE